MIFLELFLIFAKISFCGFGGYSMMSMMSANMLAKGWMTATEVLDIIAIAEMTPGSLGINSATFAGMKTAFIPGALAATLGIMIPSLTLTLIIARVYEKWKNNQRWQAILYGIRPICLSMIIANIFLLLDDNYIVSGQLSMVPIGIGAIIAFVIWKWKPGIPVIIISAAVLGLIFA